MMAAVDMTVDVVAVECTAPVGTVVKSIGRVV